MRLTVEVLQSIEPFYNTCGDYQANIRGMRVPAIENFGVLRDAFDTVDLSDNSISVLGGFSQCLRLKTLFIGKNQIHSIDPDLPRQLPKLSTLIIPQNQLSTFDAISPLYSLPITHLVMEGNPISLLEEYRRTLIHFIPTLTVLDYQKVTQKERVEASKHFGPDISPKGNASFSQFYQQGDQVKGQFHVIHGSDNKIELSIFDPANTLVLMKQENSHSFNFSANQAGIFKFLFVSRSGLTEQTINFLLDQFISHNQSQESKHTDSVYHQIYEHTLSRFDYVILTQDEAKFSQRNRRELASTMNNRLSFWSKLLIIAALVSSAIQIYSLRRLFINRNSRV
ncbi:putative U2 small nuclear ribonucleoprotein A' [Blattamonas nauphoetae]|uniref:U2 small nuclear ribonucleoprotein A n=1 Tax=Blattamonas nauphoetae TaxID=2049346 RepID=A0ABQ9X268_9EUKA|nr:putative U2 small nuclear ribonucleoprotein A' [Blattamonas nauphoetae]